MGRSTRIVDLGRWRVPRVPEVPTVVSECADAGGVRVGRDLLDEAEAVGGQSAQRAYAPLDPLEPALFHVALDG